jgi:hypothetical protein
MNQPPLISFLKSVLAFYQTMLRFCVVSIKNFWYVSLLGLFITAAAFYYYASTKSDLYTGTASFTFRYLNKKVYGDRLFMVQRLVEQQQASDLAKLLQIPVKSAKSIVSFHAKNVAGSPLQEDYTEQKYPFYTEVITTNKVGFYQLENALVNYLNTSKFDQDYIRSEHIKLRKKQQIFQADLKRIDSLKELITINDLPNYTEAITLIENISNQLLAIEQQLKKPVSIEVLNEFVPVKTEKSQLVMSFAKKIGLLFIIISVVVSVLFQLNFKDKK